MAKKLWSQSIAVNLDAVDWGNMDDATMDHLCEAISQMFNSMVETLDISLNVLLAPKLENFAGEFNVYIED